MSFWIDYTVEQGPNRFRVVGDWDKEVMGYDKNGNKIDRSALYNPGEVYIVDEDGWLRKSDHLSTLMMAYEAKKNERK
jgi:hypothetical protein